MSRATTRAASALAGGLLVAGAGLTAWGFRQFTWPAAIPFYDGGLARFAIVVAVSAFAIAVALRLLARTSAVAIAATLAAMVAVACGALWPLVACLLLAGSCALLGDMLLGVLRSPREDWLAAGLVGAGVYATLFALLAPLPVHYPGVYGFALAVPWLLARAPLRRLADAVGAVAKRDDSGWPLQSLDVAIAAVASAHFVAALMPEFRHDALAVHLLMPAELAWRHRWDSDVDTYIWVFMPALGDWMFAMGYMLAGESGARLVNFGFILALAGVIRQIVSWAGGGRVAVRWAVLLLLASPLTFTESSSLFIESVWATYAVAGTFAFLRGSTREPASATMLPRAGAFFGLALSAKAITSTLVVALLPLVIWRIPRWLGPKWRRETFTGLALLLAFGTFPYAHAWWKTGNPVFPYFNGLFRSPLFTAHNMELPATLGKGVAWDSLYQITFHSERYLEAFPGAAGFHWLLLLPATLAVLAVGRSRRALAVLLVAVLAAILCFLQAAYLRYVFPSAAMASAAIAIALEQTSRMSRPVHWFFCAGAAFAISANLLFFTAGSDYGDFPLASLWDSRARDASVEKHQPLRSAVELVNQLNVSESPVGVFAAPMVAGLRGKPLLTNWYNPPFLAAAAEMTSDAAMGGLLAQRDVSFVLLDERWGLDESWGGGGKQLAAVRAVTDEIASFGPISVRSLNRRARLDHELLANPGLAGRDGWTLWSRAEVVAGQGLRVTVDSPATQTVPVVGGRRYLLSIAERCEAAPGEARLQVNWLDAQLHFVTTNISVVVCKAALTEHSAELKAPANAAFAVVYASGHSPAPVIFRSVSFRQ